MCEQLKFGDLGAYTTLVLSDMGEGIIQLKLSRPSGGNSVTLKMLQELNDLLGKLQDLDNLRVLILLGEGKHFCTGLDLREASEILSPQQDQDEEDTPRNAIRLERRVKMMQEAVNKFEELRVPVIVGIQGYCWGAGFDIINACDIRYSTTAQYSIKEVDVGMAADMGTLQRLPLNIGNSSKMNELCYTGESFSEQEALSLGFISKVFKDYNELLQGINELAKKIASKSPIAVYGIKKVLTHAKTYQIKQSLDYNRTLTMALLYSTDVKEAAMASMQKTKPIFPKL